MCKPHRYRVYRLNKVRDYLYHIVLKDRKLWNNINLVCVCKMKCLIQTHTDTWQILCGYKISSVQYSDYLSYLIRVKKSCIDLYSDLTSPHQIGTILALSAMTSILIFWYRKEKKNIELCSIIIQFLYLYSLQIVRLHKKIEKSYKWSDCSQARFSWLFNSFVKLFNS